jgi:hypothetical protein
MEVDFLNQREVEEGVESRWDNLTMEDQQPILELIQEVRPQLLVGIQVANQQYILANRCLLEQVELSL